MQLPLIIYRSRVKIALLFFAIQVVPLGLALGSYNFNDYPVMGKVMAALFVALSVYYLVIFSKSGVLTKTPALVFARDQVTANWGKQNIIIPADDIDDITISNPTGYIYGMAIIFKDIDKYVNIMKSLGVKHYRTNIDAYGSPIFYGVKMLKIAPDQLVAFLTEYLAAIGARGSQL